jgi:hypothetical protein
MVAATGRYHFTQPLCALEGGYEAMIATVLSVFPFFFLFLVRFISRPILPEMENNHPPVNYRTSLWSLSA